MKTDPNNKSGVERRTRQTLDVYDNDGRRYDISGVAEKLFIAYLTVCDFENETQKSLAQQAIHDATIYVDTCEELGVLDFHEDVYGNHNRRKTDEYHAEWLKKFGDGTEETTDEERD